MAATDNRAAAETKRVEQNMGVTILSVCHKKILREPADRALAAG
jgi:hypothetical protein